MRDIRAIQFERRIAAPGVPVPSFTSEPDGPAGAPAAPPTDPAQENAPNLLPRETELPHLYQQLEQTGSLPPQDVPVVIRDLYERIQKLEGGEGDDQDKDNSAPTPDADAEAPEAPEEAPEAKEGPKK